MLADAPIICETQSIVSCARRLVRLDGVAGGHRDSLRKCLATHVGCCSPASGVHHAGEQSEAKVDESAEIAVEEPNVRNKMFLDTWPQCYVGLAIRHPVKYAC